MRRGCIVHVRCGVVLSPHNSASPTRKGNLLPLFATNPLTNGASPGVAAPRKWWAKGALTWPTLPVAVLPMAEDSCVASLTSMLPLPVCINLERTKLASRAA